MIEIAIASVAALYTAWFVVREAVHPSQPPAAATEPVPEAAEEQPHEAVKEPVPEPEPAPPDGSIVTETLAIGEPALEPLLSDDGDGSRPWEVAVDEALTQPYDPFALAPGPALEAEPVAHRAVGTETILEDVVEPPTPLPRIELPPRAIGVPRFRPDPERLIQTEIYVRRSLAARTTALARLIVAVTFFGLLLGITLVGGTRAIISLLGG